MAVYLITKGWNRSFNGTTVKVKKFQLIKMRKNFHNGKRRDKYLIRYFSFIIWVDILLFMLILSVQE